MIRPSSALACLVLAVVAAGCGGPAPTPVGTPAVTVHVSATNLAFDQAHITVPPDVTFAIEFENRDAAPHNIVIRGRDVSRTTDAFSGPQTRTFVFAALPAGTYGFACAIHPEMTGVIEASTLSEMP